MAKKTNGAAKAPKTAPKKAVKATPAKADNGDKSASDEQPEISPEVAKQIASIRSSVRENFGKVAMAMMMLPRYRSQTIADLQHLLLDPLMRDRLAIAYPAKAEEKELNDMTGFAIWASVSEEVDAQIREQIKANVFPVRLKTEDWNSGKINWLLDVVAPTQKATATVISNFRQLIDEGGLRLHPVITRLVDQETLKKMGAEKLASAEQQQAVSPSVN